MSLAPITNTTLTTLAVARILVGAGSLVSPQRSCALLGLEYHRSSAMLSRLFGGRDFALGAALYWALRKYWVQRGVEEGKKRDEVGLASFWLLRQLRMVVWLGVICDAIDIASVAVGVLEGTLERGSPVVSLGAPAVGATLLGLLGLRGL